MNIKHSTQTDEWHTPMDILDRVRSTLGSIDFDPASSYAANIDVKATRYLTRHDDALVKPWDCEGQSIFLNPPGGKTGNCSNTVLFWQKLLAHRKQFAHAIFLAFSIEAMATTQKPEFPSILEFPFCVPAKRIRFVRPDGSPGPAPSHANVLVYVPGRSSFMDRFHREFSPIGKVIAP